MESTRQGHPDTKLLELLVCPLTRTALHYDRDRAELLSVKARLAFPVRDGIPIMLVSEARQMTDQEVADAS
ncbi:Trm112 family protein [Pseudohoeflea coraliihabitans]|uniref:UPF0434 protein KY465_05910 n=1 Tax=Pseudohoeflea coraliihabitans TaxID=2860393 RepID=A0ABS6WNY8_9HYPH|nr:Trm112 family protein [Pseudohoeflea sp. DP4N28-3]MBW3096810.1 Trm112 family protein [Pseudohoeflea sp. DP4N28-3]